MNSESDEDLREHKKRVERVCLKTADELRTCRDDALAQLRACCRYFESGEREGISHEELIDFLGISSHSVLDRAGYSVQDALRVMKLLPLITQDKDGRLHAPDALPPQPPPQAPPPEQQDFGI
jgi:hypothetical protein